MINKEDSKAAMDAPVATVGLAVPMNDTPAAAPEPVTLDDWCKNESNSDRRVSLLAAFFYDENKGGRVRDFAANYKQRYAEFAARPVN